jgi:hypothetical protein
MIRYIFVVRDLHPLLLAGFTGALHMSTALPAAAAAEAISPCVLAPA